MLILSPLSCQYRTCPHFTVLTFLPMFTSDETMTSLRWRVCGDGEDRGLTPPARAEFDDPRSRGTDDHRQGADAPARREASHARTNDDHGQGADAPRSHGLRSPSLDRRSQTGG